MSDIYEKTRFPNHAFDLYNQKLLLSYIEP